MEIVRTVFQNAESRDGSGVGPKLVIVLDMGREMGMNTADIPGLVQKMEMALPGIFPDEDSPYLHTCGGLSTGVEVHSFRDEIKRGTDIPHLLEHVLLHLLSRRTNHCSAYCGQRATDLERGIATHYYLVVDCPSRIEGIVAADLAYNFVTSWIGNNEPIIDPAAYLDGIRATLEPMVGFIPNNAHT